MPGPQTAIRQEDEITHSDALFGAVEGILIGLAVGALVGAAIVVTGGLAVVSVGAVLVGGGIGGMFGKTIGRHSTHPKGHVLTGSANVFIGFDKRPAARAWADVAHCDDHSDSEPAHDQPGILGKRIAQGSGTVFINGHPAAREGDKGSCDFTLGEGWPTVFIGGPTVTVEKIDAEVPAFVDDLIAGMAIVGTALIMWPAAVAMFSAGTAAGLGGSALGVGANLLQVGLRLGAQIYVGTKLSEAGGAIGHATAGFFGAADGSLASDLATLTGQTAAPFAGGGLYKGIAEAPLPGMEAPTAVPEGVVDPAAPTDSVQRGPTGSRTEFSGTPAEQAQADAAYDRIRADDGDVARIASNTGYPEDHIAAVKQHLFYNEHDLNIPNYETGEFPVVRQRFTSEPDIADLWTKAANGTLGEPGVDGSGQIDPETADPLEVPKFHALIAHEYVEQGLMADGMPYLSPDSWGYGERGWHTYPDAQNAGAHDLSPNASFRGKDPFFHYDSMGRSSDGIPRPNEDLSNLDDVVSGIRRRLGGGDGPAGSAGSSGEPAPASPPTSPGETVQQIGPHDGGAPGDAPPDDAGTGKTTPPAAEPPTPANDDVPGQAGDAASSGETTEQTSSSNGGAPGKAPPEQPGGTGDEAGDAASGKGETGVPIGDVLGGEVGGADESDPAATDAEADAEDPEMARALQTYDALGDTPPRVDISKNDAAYTDAHTLERHGPDVPLERSSAPVGDRTIEGRIYGDAPWRMPGSTPVPKPDSFSYRWKDLSTMNRTVNDYLQNNWEQVRSDLAQDGVHEATFNIGNAVGEGYYNSSYYTPNPPNAVYGKTSMAGVVIKTVPGDPSTIKIISTYPNGKGFK